MPTQVMPRRLLVKLPYWDVLDIGESGNVTAEYSMALNGIFDPDLTGTGHQPRGRDQYATLYAGYLVRGCRWSVRLYGADDAAITAAGINIMGGVICGPEGVATEILGSSISDFMEYPADKKYMKVRYFARNTGMTNAGFALGQSVRMSGYVNCKRLAKDYEFAGVTSSYGEAQWPTDYMTANGANPASPALQVMTVFAQCLPQDSNATALNTPALFAIVKMVYYVEFINPIFPTVS